MQVKRTEREERGHRIEQWWAEGLTMREIAAHLGWAIGRVGTEIEWLRSEGFGLPYRAARVSIEERFWSKVDKRGPNECWLWTSPPTGGYGQLGRERGEGPPIRAHVFSLSLVGVEVPKGFHTHHTCETKLCVNPAHLQVVTPGEHRRIHEGSMQEGCPKCGVSREPDRKGKLRCLPCDAARKRESRNALTGERREAFLASERERQRRRKRQLAGSAE